uniref:Uncharacterized protein n=1 Tax=Setaria viridis TaxID=4556 RepID=A0A4U6UBS8_SETVI|nr:hypothetical protein SEVIR_6G203600v2 [Setaria viridis]
MACLGPFGPPPCPSKTSGLLLPNQPYLLHGTFIPPTAASLATHPLPRNCHVPLSPLRFLATPQRPPPTALRRLLSRRSRPPPPAALRCLPLQPCPSGLRLPLATSSHDGAGHLLPRPSTTSPYP